MSDFFENILKTLAYKFTSIKEKRIVFTAFNGKYADSPRFISEKMHEIAPEYEIVWLILPKYANALPDYVRWFDIDSIEAQKIRGSAVAIVDNVYCNRAYTIMSNKLIYRMKGKVFGFLYNKPKQFAVTTWHGAAFKKAGRDQIGNESICDFICPGVSMVCGDRHSMGIFKHLTFNKLDMHVLGTPRNDMLFSSCSKIELKKSLGLPEDRKILLFAPTFRNDGPDVEGKNINRSGLEQLEQMDFNILAETLHDKFGGDWMFICRFHYHVSFMVDWESLERKYGDLVLNGNAHEEMADYLVCSDMLLTDASSCMFDYALTRKPCFLFFPDIANYRDKERGFYSDINELPFPVSSTFEQLIGQMKDFDSDEYVSKVEDLIREYGMVDDGNSALRVAEFILDRIGKK